MELRNDPRFHSLERLLSPATREERRRTPDSEPAVDWAAVLQGAEELADDGRDLRLLVIVVRALYAADGYDGVAEGLKLLRTTLAEYWDTLHPELRDRPSLKEAAVRRINALYQLENEDDGLLCDLQYGVVFEMRGLGRFRGTDVAAAGLTRMAFLNEIPSGLGEAERSALEAEHEARATRVQTACKALAAEDPPRSASLLASVTAAREALQLLEDQISAQVLENGVGVRFQVLGRFLDRLISTLSASASMAVEHTAGEPVSSDAPAAMSGGQVPAEASPRTSPAPAAAGGPVTSRQDVVRLLDQIIEFYDRTEPASPIPLLARRMRKMVPMTFIQLMEEVAPSGLKEFRNVAGVSEK